MIKNNKYGIIDKYGKEIVNPVYDEIYWFKDGRAVVKNMKKFGAVDISENWLFHWNMIPMVIIMNFQTDI